MAYLSNIPHVMRFCPHIIIAHTIAKIPSTRHAHHLAFTDWPVGNATCTSLFATTATLTDLLKTCRFTNVLVLLPTSQRMTTCRRRPAKRNRSAKIAKEKALSKRGTGSFVVKGVAGPASSGKRHRLTQAPRRPPDQPVPCLSSSKTQSARTGLM
jgi:hypothetical protein